ncbi:hypothetical protein [Thiocapsa bogorovii]|uniref:hypothetical protein n=1 Tax=Thiocapsa bogorovii TaxID=521689 RepID=UPI001E2E6640|nr:hypothetical protein [Thiocapsa bogorovii]UHD18476.1 hypothetical protein LT988_10785 [Thiocapsa bogorovii]
MKNILGTLALTLVISPAFAGQGGFGVGGPDSYIWAEIGTETARIAESRSASPEEHFEDSIVEGSTRFADMDRTIEGRIPSNERMNSDLAPASTFYGGFL